MVFFMRMSCGGLWGICRGGEMLDALKTYIFTFTLIMVYYEKKIIKK